MLINTNNSPSYHSTVSNVGLTNCTLHSCTQYSYAYTTGTTEKEQGELITKGGQTEDDINTSWLFLLK